MNAYIQERIHGDPKKAAPPVTASQASETKKRKRPTVDDDSFSESSDR
jgi:hypothetical protein